MLISKYALDAKPANDTDNDTTWETSTLRAWLNKEFLQEAFASEEKPLIATSTVKTESNIYGTNPGKHTVDQIFLLNIWEANIYYNSQELRKNYGTPTALPKARKKNMTIPANAGCAHPAMT